jgi:hypothetical protein
VSDTIPPTTLLEPSFTDAIRLIEEAAAAQRAVAIGILTIAPVRLGISLGSSLRRT